MTKLCPRGKAAAKRKFKVYPSAYANAYASKICAGKIKDPSGVKRKDFRGPKPTGAKDGKMISRDQRQKEIRKKQNPISEYDEKGKLKYTAAKKGKAMMTAGSQSAMGRIQKAKMIKAKRGRLTFDEKFKMQEKGLTDKKTGKLIPAHERVLKDLKTSELKKMTKTGRNPRLGPGKGFPESKLEARSFLERRGITDRALKAAKATRIGKIAAGVAGAALLGKAALEKMYEKRTGKKPFTKRPKGNSKGGLKAELNNPAKGYMAGGMADYYKDLM